MDAVTVVISTQPTRVAKVYSKENGVVTKEAIGDISEGTAYTKIVSNAHEMAELLACSTRHRQAIDLTYQSFSSAFKASRRDS